MWRKKWTLRAEADEGEGSAGPVEGGADAPAPDSNVWDDLLDEGVEGVEAEGPAAEAGPGEEVGGEPETKPEAEVVVAVEAPPAAAAVVEKPVEVAQQPPAQVVSQAQVAPVPAPTPEQIMAFRQRMLETIEQRYVLPEDEATAFQVEPEKVLPKLAARLHASIYDHVMQSIAQQAPMVVARQLQERQASQTAEDTFYARWPELRSQAAQVQQVARMWRQMYPQATMQEAVEGVGQATKALLGLGGQAAAPQASESAPVTPPPAPARPSARGPAPLRGKQMSAEEQAFADLAKSFEEEY